MRELGRQLDPKKAAAVLTGLLQSITWRISLSMSSEIGNTHPAICPMPGKQAFAPLRSARFLISKEFRATNTA